MLFEITAVRLFGASDKTSQLVKETVSGLFPNAQVSVSKSMDELPEPLLKQGAELLVLAGETVGEAEKLAAMLDGEGLPRWAVVALGGESDERFETVSGSPDARLLTQAFRAAVTRHRLQRENAMLRGDLLTIAGRVSHDLKSPLNGILAASEAVKEVLQEKDPASLVLTNSLFTSVDEMVKLLNRTSFMIKATSLSLPRKKISMGDVVWTVLQRMESKIIAKKVKILEPETWPEVQAVEPWLEVVWGNLIGNVLEHGQATEIELGWSDDKSDACNFWVRDNGKGVSQIRQSKLFTPFHSLNAPGNGHGLGLPIAQRLVDLHGGSMEYKPVPQGGSLFTFSLPLHR